MYLNWMRLSSALQIKCAARFVVKLLRVDFFRSGRWIVVYHNILYADGLPLQLVHLGTFQAQLPKVIVVKHDMFSRHHLT